MKSNMIFSLNDVTECLYVILFFYNIENIFELHTKKIIFQASFGPHSTIKCIAKY